VVWLQSYRQRFGDLPRSVQVLSPPNLHAGHDFRPSTAIMSQVASCFSFASDTTIADAEFADVSLSPPIHPDSVVPFGSAPPITRSQQPFRADIDRVVATFFDIDAVRNLRLSGATLAAVLCDLESTTHPDALAPAYDTAYVTLRHALPRFLVHSTTVASRPTQLFMFARGGSTLALGIIVFLSVFFGATQGTAQLSEAGIRGLRLLVFPFVAVAMLDILWAAQGHCRITATKGLAQLQSWETDESTGAFNAQWSDATEPTDEKDDVTASYLAEAEDGRANVKSEGMADIPASLSRHACWQASRVKEQLLTDIASLDLPKLRWQSPAAQPVVISFTRATMVAVDESCPSSPRLSMQAVVISKSEHEDGKLEEDIVLTDNRTKPGLVAAPVCQTSDPLNKQASERAQRPAVMTKAVLDPRMLTTHRRIELFTLLTALGIALVRLSFLYLSSGY
jgi:hypothetical protein